MSAKRNDPIEELQEWQEHQYNPGYWVNRFTPEFPPKRSMGRWLLELFQVLIIVPAFFFMSYVYFFVEKDSLYLPMLGVLGVISIVGILRALRVKPLATEIPPEKQHEFNRKKKREKKKRLPKRRKDYH